jgi:TolB-like protein/DNA-binding winged helix-turn-helix (wHTH) protein/Tfp pilus assembly protein PilF
MSLMEKEIYEFGPFSLDPAERVILRDGNPLSLTPKVFDTLLCLVRNRGRLLTKDELLKEIWPDTFVEEVNLAVNISTLRKMFEESPQDGRYIATVPGWGYRFVADVREIPNGYGNQQSPISGNDSATAFLVDSRAPKRELLEYHHPKTSGAGGLVTSTASGENRRRSKFAIPVAIVLSLIGTISGYVWFEQKTATVPATKTVSIAVLPFADLSPGKDQEYFSDGLSEELINDLAQVPGIRVIARSSAFQFKGKNEDPRVVGKKLGVANILEGSVHRDGDRIRIMAELIKVDEGLQLWSETYDRKIDDIFAVQDEIARAAAGALQVKLLDANGAALSASARSTNPGAYQAYLQAQAFFGSGEDKGNLERALASVNEAIRRDPNYAPAWALRSFVRSVMAAFSMTDMAGGFALARQDAEHATELNPRLATGYLALGWVQIMYDWDWEHAEASLNKAAELEPGSVEVLRYSSSLSRTLGRQDEAIELYKRVIALDPLRARSYSSLGGQLYNAGRYEEANAMLQRALELNPQKEHDHLIRGQILLAQGRPQQALAEMEQEPGEGWKLFGESLAYHRLGQPRDSEAALSKVIAEHEKEWAYQIADVYAYRGESDKAFEWLDRAYRQRDGGLMFVKIDPLLTGLRQDPRYTEVLKKMHLPL